MAEGIKKMDLNFIRNFLHLYPHAQRTRVRLEDSQSGWKEGYNWGVRARACSSGRARDVTSTWSSGMFPAIGVRVRYRYRGSHRVVIRV